MRPSATNRPPTRSQTTAMERLTTGRTAHIRSAIARGIGAIAVLAGVLGGGLGGQTASDAATASPQRLIPSQAAQPAFANATAALNFAELTPAAAQTPTAPTSEAAIATESDLAAPSAIWLVVMPAVPIVGGTLIYLSRRWFGGEQRECRLVAHVAPPPAPTEETPPDSESP